MRWFDGGQAVGDVNDDNDNRDDDDREGSRGPGDIDVANIEARITTFLSEGQLPGVEADCPGPVEAKEGATVECTLSGGAIDGKATATLADAAGMDFSLVYDYTSGPDTKGNGNATSVP